MPYNNRHNKIMKQIMAGEVRPDHYISLTGYANDADRVNRISFCNQSYEITIYLDSGESRKFPVDFPVVIEGNH